MYIDADTIIKAAAVLAALGAFGGLFYKAITLYNEVKTLRARIDQKEADIIERHDRDIAAIQKEPAIVTYGVLACLKGLAEKGCNGPVHEAINKIEKYLNGAAHDQI